MQAAPTILKAENLYKYFHHGEVTALKGAAIRLRSGEVHGLIGENGSGKTTLVRCLAGILVPDSGEINGSSNIALVPQLPELIPSLTLYDYLVLAAPGERKEIENKKVRFCTELGIDIPLHIPAYKLPANQITLGVLLGALLKNPDFLFLDEPTTSFTPAETDKLFRYLRTRADRGMGIVLVSHKIEEIYSKADRLTVLRKGEVVRECMPEEIGIDELSRNIMGGKGPESLATSGKAGNKGTACLTFQGAATLSRGTRLEDISFELYEGEILAITGIRENGLDQLEQVLTLQTNLSSGTIMLADSQPFPSRPESLRDSGVAIIPSDRQRSGAALSLSIADNGAAAVRKKLTRRGFLFTGQRKKYAKQLLEDYKIKASPEASAAALSGGMLQRLILARDLESPGKILVLCEPGWGLDVRSRTEIYRHIRALSLKGHGILLLASDIDEVLDIADRLLVLHQGKIEASFLKDEFDHQKIGDAVLGLQGKMGKKEKSYDQTS